MEREIEELRAERDAFKAQCKSLLSDIVRVADIEIERDEALARCARMEEALRQIRRDHTEYNTAWPERGIDEIAKTALSAPSSLPWVREKIAEELSRMDIKLLNTCKDSLSKDYQHGMRVAAAACRSRAAELRRKKGA